MITNRQSRVPIRTRALSLFAGRARAGLRLGRGHFDVTLVSDTEIKRLNRIFRGKDAATDVLSFPWNDETEVVEEKKHSFLGDIIISAPAARRNAVIEDHSAETEIKQLILHGLLHLLGYDHERDRGEMDGLELRLRRRLGIEGETQVKSQK